MSEVKKGSLFMRAMESLFSLSGETGRVEFLAALPMLAILVVLCVTMMVAFASTGRSDGFSLTLIYLIFGLPAMILQAKRLRSAGLHRYAAWAVGALLQVVVVMGVLILLQQKVQWVPWELFILGWIVFLAALPVKKAPATSSGRHTDNDRDDNERSHKDKDDKDDGDGDSGDGGDGGD